MALIVEDGSGNPQANSYIDVAKARQYASARGKTLPSEDAAVEVLLIEAMDFIEARRSDFQGRKSSPENALQWPREGVRIDGFELPSDALPRALLDAQAQLAIDGVGQELMPIGAGREVLSESVDVISVSYAQTGSNSVQPVFTKALALLKPLFRQGAFLSSVRV